MAQITLVESVKSGRAGAVSGLGISSGIRVRVGHLSSAAFAGGAARAGFRLHEGLREAGVDSVWLDGSGMAPGGEGIRRLEKPVKPRGLTAKLRRKWAGESPARRMRRELRGAVTYHSWPEGWSGQVLGDGGEGPEIWNLHWVANFLDWEKSLPALAASAPVVWTLHDLNPLRGVWHYEPSGDEAGLDAADWNGRALALKRKALEGVPGDRLVFVAPSRWMADECRKSALVSRFEVAEIPYGVPEKVFFPVPKEAARQALGLPGDGVLLGFVADTLEDPRKGMRELEAALAEVPRVEGMRLISAGGGPAGRGWMHFGPIRDDRLMRLFYSACDLFVCPSLQDNLPNTVLEAMACGTAAAGFDVGGLPDMIVPGETGWLAGEGGLARVLAEAMAEPERLRRMGEEGRRRMERHFSLRLQAERYLKLYRRLTGNAA